jgi:hypothetical protein
MRNPIWRGRSFPPLRRGVPPLVRRGGRGGNSPVRRMWIILLYNTVDGLDRHSGGRSTGRLSYRYVAFPVVLCILTSSFVRVHVAFAGVSTGDRSVQLSSRSIDGHPSTCRRRCVDGHENPCLRRLFASKRSRTTSSTGILLRNDL